VSRDVTAALAGTPRGRLLGAVAIAAGLTPLNSTMIAIALPAISGDFGVAAAAVTAWVVTGYLVAVMSCQIPAGTVADRIGYARALDLGRWLFTLGTAAGFLAPGIGFVVAGRFLMAAGGALMVPTAMALIRVAVPAERRPSAFGAMGAVMGTAAALGPAVGGFITTQFGWRFLFLVNLPLVMVSWMLQPRGLAAARPGPRGDRPLVDLRFLRVPVYAAGAAVIGLQNLGFYALLFQVPFLYHRGGPAAGAPRGEAELGLVMMAMTVTMAAWSPVGGRIAESLGVRRVVIAGGCAGAFGVAVLTQFALDGSLGGLAAGLLLVGFGLGISTGPSQAAALGAVDQTQSAMAAALLAMTRYAGGIAGTAILSVALAGGAGNPARHAVALWCFAAALAASAVCSLALPRAAAPTT
jgi:MFS family permease